MIEWLRGYFGTDNASTSRTLYVGDRATAVVDEPTELRFSPQFHAKGSEGKWIPIVGTHHYTSDVHLVVQEQLRIEAEGGIVVRIDLR